MNKWRKANLLIKRLEFPHTFSQVVDLVPPSQTNQYTPTHILNHPEVKGSKKNSDNKDYDKAVEEESRENVKCQRSTLVQEQKYKLVTIVRYPIFYFDQQLYSVHTLKRTWKRHVFGFA